MTEVLTKPELIEYSKVTHLVDQIACEGYGMILIEDSDTETDSLTLTIVGNDLKTSEERVFELDKIMVKLSGTEDLEAIQSKDNFVNSVTIETIRCADGDEVEVRYVPFLAQGLSLLENAEKHPLYVSDNILNPSSESLVKTKENVINESEKISKKRSSVYKALFVDFAAVLIVSFPLISNSIGASAYILAGIMAVLAVRHSINVKSKNAQLAELEKNRSSVANYKLKNKERSVNKGSTLLISDSVNKIFL